MRYSAYDENCRQQGQRSGEMYWERKDCDRSAVEVRELVVKVINGYG
jgi:hypothetical protein